MIPAGKTSIYLCAKSLDVALVNCALCVEAARRACVSRTPAFAPVRPPGHHASAEFGSYRLLNTVVSPRGRCSLVEVGDAPMAAGARARAWAGWGEG